MVSRFAMIAVAGGLMGISAMPAFAADLGGGCCGDLEERVAELEATVARKGNRVVSLQIYGEVSKGLLIYDNGKESDALVTDNDAIGTLIGIKGEAKIAPGWKAGYKLEFAFQTDVSSVVTEEKKGDDNTNFSIRHNFLYVESERWGRISLGQTSTASDGAAEVQIANTLAVGSPDQGGGLHPGGLIAGALGLDQYTSDFDGGRNDIVRYDSPTIYGFTVSAAWGDNDYQDVALRFAKQFNSVKVAAAIAYADDHTSNIKDAQFTQLIGSATAMHIPTGLFIMAAAGKRDFEASDVEGKFWFVQGGIERKWLPYGNTTIYAEYGNYDSITVDTDGAKTDMWGLGVVQHIDSAALDLYAQARFWSVDDAARPAADELNTIMIGANMAF